MLVFALSQDSGSAMAAARTEDLTAMMLDDLIERAREAPYAQHGQLRVTVENFAHGFAVGFQMSGRPATRADAEVYLAGMDI